MFLSQQLFEIMNLTRAKVLLDLGHGIGTVCLQAACTIGCNARGIEIVGDRRACSVGLKLTWESWFQKEFNLQNRKCNTGTVDFVHGSFEDRCHWRFILDADVVFFDNFNGVFGPRSHKKDQQFSLEDVVAGLFACMKTGVVMVTLDDLLGLGLSKPETNELQ